MEPVAIFAILIIFVLGYFYFKGTSSSPDTISKNIASSAASSSSSSSESLKGKVFTLDTTNAPPNCLFDEGSSKGYGEIKIQFITENTLNVYSSMKEKDAQNNSIELKINTGCLRFTREGDTLHVVSQEPFEYAIIMGEKVKYEDTKKNTSIEDFTPFDLIIKDGTLRFKDKPADCPPLKKINETAPTKCPNPEMGCQIM